jgi:prephenate dehydrogenase
VTKHLGIIGTGLIGASMGLRARSLGWRVTGTDADPAALRSALELGALSEGGDPLGARLDVLAIAVPVGATVEIVRRLAASPPDANLTIDVASLQGPPAGAGAGLKTFVATHPIAGAESSGPRGARADLFAGASWAYVPPASAEVERDVRAFIEAMGARPVPIAATAHDATVALTSGLPQIVAVALAEFVASRLDESTLEMCGPGMRGMTRLGASSWSMWRDIVAGTSGNLAQEVREFAAILSSLADAIERGDGRELSESFERAAGAVARLRANANAPSVVSPSTPVHD